MKIQINTDKNVSVNESRNALLIDSLSEGLSRFSDQITRLEVHLSDEDGNKDGLNDIRCMLEARLEGRPPIAVTNQADTREQAVKGAMDKLKHVLTTSLGRLKHY
jgi:ribosome-associated translation inhibitor RaiA